MTNFPITRTIDYSTSRILQSKKTISVGPSFLDSVLSSVNCDLDATLSDSYDGSGQVWANVIAAPADGANQTHYSFWRGSGIVPTTDDPTFVGPAGDKTAHWTLDGGDLFTLNDLITNQNPTLWNAHKTTGGTDWWMAAAFRHEGGTSFQQIFGDINGINNGVEVLVRGSATGVRVNVDRGGSRTSNNFSVNITSGADFLVIVSFDFSTDDLRVWANARTALTDTDASANTSTADTTDDYTLGARDSVVLPMKVNSRYYHFSCGNEFLDDTKAGLIIDHLNARHNRTYA